MDSFEWDDKCDITIIIAVILTNFVSRGKHGNCCLLQGPPDSIWARLRDRESWRCLVTLHQVRFCNQVHGLWGHQLLEVSEIPQSPRHLWFVWWRELRTRQPFGWGCWWQSSWGSPSSLGRETWTTWRTGVSPQLW